MKIYILLNRTLGRQHFGMHQVRYYCMYKSIVSGALSRPCAFDVCGLEQDTEAMLQLNIVEEALKQLEEKASPKNSEKE